MNYISKLIDEIFGREGFQKMYGAYPHRKSQAYAESFLRTIYYLLFVVVGVMITVALSQPEYLTILSAIIFSGLAAGSFLLVRYFANRVREDSPENSLDINLAETEKEEVENE